MATLRGALFIVIALGLIAFAATRGVEVFGSKNNRYVLPASAALAFERLDFGKMIRYRGQDGKTVQELLIQAAEIEVDPNNPAELLKIAGRKANPPDSVWTFTIDGQEQTAPAGDTPTKNGQQIEWRLE